MLKVLLVILLLPIFSFANEGEKIDYVNKELPSILLFGDSIISGYKLKKQHHVSTLLEDYLEDRSTYVKIINGGVSGDTTGDGLSRINSIINKYRPNMIIIALGGNDLLKRIDPYVVKQNLDGIIYATKRHGIETILSRVTAPSNYGSEYQLKFNSLYDNLADEHELNLYPFLLKNLFGNKELMMRDGIHPNSKGTELIAREIGEYIIDNYVFK